MALLRDLNGETSSKAASDSLLNSLANAVAIEVPIDLPYSMISSIFKLVFCKMKERTCFASSINRFSEQIPSHQLSPYPGYSTANTLTLSELLSKYVSI